MICTSIKGKTLEQILSILDDPHVEMAEIRLDLNRLADTEIEDLFASCEKPLIATFRVSASSPQALQQKTWAEASAKLELAASSGARYVDLDIAAPASVSQAMRKICRRTGTELIRSFHDFDKTPDLSYLKQVVARCFRYGADIAKVVTTARYEQDCDLVESLYDDPDSRGHLIAFVMGEEASSTRMECLKRGAPFSYCAYDEPVAPGQFQVDDMHDRVYGDFLGIYRDDFEVPASKSFAIRAIVAAALAEGTSKLHAYTPCADSEAAVAFARSLGAKVHHRDNALTITGIGPVAPGSLHLERINAGESGLLARIAIPLLSLLDDCPFTVEGSGTLVSRPLKDASGIMASFGTMLRNESVHDDKEVYIPLNVNGRLVPGNAQLPGGAGSQLVTGLLMTLPLAGGSSRLHIDEPKSIPYMFITLDVLRSFGIETGAQLEGDEEMLELRDWSYCNGIRFDIEGGRQFKAAEISLESDWSAAANFLVAGALYGGVEVEGLDTSSLQADISIMDVLVEAGAAVASGEDVVSVRKAPLDAFDFDLNQAPDIIPIVSLLAAFCSGKSTIAGVGRLRSKESDRAQAILDTLLRMGVNASIEGDVLSVEGESLCSRILNARLLKGGEYSTFHDHRMAMMLRIAAIGADSPIYMDDKDCISKSFPDFFGQFS